MNRRIYFDNAATSFPKPESVYKTMDHYAREVGASAGRGAYREAMESGEIIAQCRGRIAKLINAPDVNSIIMTFNCTDGLALAIKGTLIKPGQHVVTTRMDHNSVLRPLYALSEQMGIEVSYVRADSEGLVDVDDLRRAVKSNTALIACVHGSNVCGSLQDIKTIGQFARDLEIPYLVDAAQSVGHVPFDVSQLHVDMLAFPGHKALLGPLGTGVLYIRKGFEMQLRPLKEGGTGSKSEEARQPDFMPDRFEAGSHNALGIAGLNEGVKYLLDKGVANLARHERRLSELFRDGTKGIEALTVYGPKNLDKRVGVFSVRVDGYEPAELAAVLEHQFGLLTRPGLHCAPFAHDSIGTLDMGGTTRFSFGPFLTEDDVVYATECLRQIAATRPR